jgi:polysaccharide pyruvyl transferase WcaK-like protein
MGHGGAQNRGCEALVRTTAAMIPGAKITLGSSAPEADKSVFGGSIDRIIRNGPAAKPNPMWFLGAVSRRALKTDLSLPFVLGAQKQAVRECDLFVSVGGDNYCYGKPYWLMALNKEARKAGKPAVLWGASVEPGSLDAAMRADLNTLTHITARESITYYALKEAGAPVTLAPDPAFILPAEKVPLPEGFADGQMIGVNVSPLVMRYENAPGVTLAAFRELIGYILGSTSYGVALIPHVVGEADSDMKVLSHIAEAFPGRVVVADPSNGAREIKYIISRCRLLVAARTHASIAAYSSGVPALVLGYSVKARGIARDLFGSEEGLVVSAKELKSAKTLVDAFKGFVKREDELRKHLETVLPDFIGRAGQAGELLRKYI